MRISSVYPGKQFAVSTVTSWPDPLKFIILSCFTTGCQQQTVFLSKPYLTELEILPNMVIEVCVFCSVDG
jgi:hypothetical protein